MARHEAGDDPDGTARTLALRLRSQGLTGRRATSPDAVVARLVGVQAQDLAFARLAFRPRSRGLTAGDVDAARERERGLVWTWAMRGTLHLVTAADVSWLVGLLGPIFAARGRPRRLALGLDDARCERAVAVLRDLIATEGPLTRGALAARLPIDPDGQAPAHLLAYAAMRGVVCRGPLAAGREPTYVLLEDWLGCSPAPVDEDRALAELARRYLAGHGPATAQDLAAWSGIGLRRARRAFGLVAGELRELAGPSGRAWMVASAPPRAAALTSPHVRLLGHFDPYLLGFADREPVLERRFARRIQTGGGFIGPAVLVGGRVLATWRGVRRGDAMTVAVEPFEQRLDDALSAAVDREVADLGRFLGVASSTT